MKLEEFFRDMTKLLDESMKIIDNTIAKEKGEKKEIYKDYRKSIREMGAILGSLILKMRMDRVFDPKTAEGLQLLISKRFEEEK
jgi:hypothetical protein